MGTRKHATPVVDPQIDRFTNLASKVFLEKVFKYTADQQNTREKIERRSGQKCHLWNVVMKL